MTLACIVSVGVNGTRHTRCYAQSVAGNCWPLTFRSSLNIMP
ncbi:hypothetical protein HMPREF0208_01336 [Citrobacter koseri]|uniref:Uncharacterized protein n=1 Tax=Citrobacter koseri (strain ATCC BAA-895 / CDC 4225-83 / SGSC4696) TaxID=290338 RepID=A8ADH8_CITK8|nr:hypothetical protein CKO_00378 [Citrobacter koseri ATCC BAA-895]KXA00831.1 hypothetical protein HMPREF3220_01850 [Citrobacter koseri]KXA04544.1 hypothetical protein HMPREF3207_01336 [Citrobacter koseri]KXB45437.1 hypothetical protein HMPREF0208_01336 [Citrobacter koseri]